MLNEYAPSFANPMTKIRALMIRFRRVVFHLLALFLMSPRAHSFEINAEQYSSSIFTVIRIDSQQDQLQLFWRDDSKKPFNTFSNLASWLEGRGEQLAFAMNAGMFKPDYSPVGIFVSQGEEQSPLDLSSGQGNFFLKPNGIFLISETGASIVESGEYEGLKEKIILATQSGPLMVRHGAIHSAFNPNSVSRLVRNGVGITKNGEVVFAISESPVSLYQFASFFRDALHCPDALYFDGTVSGLYAPRIRRNDAKVWLGPMIGVVRHNR